MNCKPGDIARIIGAPYVGHLVEVLYAPPMGEYSLPDGHGALSLNRFTWVCRALGYTFQALTTRGARTARFADIPDKYLRPIRDPGESVQDETLLWKSVPSNQRETA